MKRVLLILTLTFFSKVLWAEHITGGEMYYTFVGMDGANFRYHITLKLYRDCNSQGAKLDDNAAIGIFNKGTRAMVWTGEVGRLRIEELRLESPGPCITNAPSVCYQVGYYEFDISLPGIPEGYTVAYQRCCRINGISNLVASGNVGATYTADIPSTSTSASAPANNSARFTGKDTVIVCGGYPFTYSFAATDPDIGDRLRYSFCGAYRGGGTDQTPGSTGPNTAAPNPPAPPPYNAVGYSFPYNSTIPLGNKVTLDPNTGLISGISPPEGIYVVTVCVEEIRNGIVIATQRKDLQIKAGGCDIANAKLDPVYTSCDGFTMSFANQSTSPLINSYYWEFGDPGSGAGNSSTSATPTHTFTVPGDYTIKLVTNRGQDCSDSTTAIVKVWPGFFPAFTTAGICITNPVNFNDGTTTAFGVVDSWFWNFGDETTLADTSHNRNPNWKYSTLGQKTISLTVTNSKGCVKTIFQTITIIDKPPITLAFKDTLICIPDAVQLNASGQGVFSWSPVVNMVGSNTATPTVNPTTTTRYYVQLDEQGCINNDSVLIRVVDHVTLNARIDTTVCEGDPTQLRIQTDGLRFQWTPAASLNNATIQNPVATVNTTTTFDVRAWIGSCFADAQTKVITIPYPIANAGRDDTICYNKSIQLNGSYVGNTFMWTPTAYLNNPNSISPVASPPRTTPFILTVYDNKGCPKPGRDTVVITVLPRIRPFAGNDTLVVIGQPLQFNAEGGVRYLWTPSYGLNDPNIKNPIGIYDAVDSIRYKVEVFNERGCSDSAFVNVVVFKTAPSIFVPSAFTPNGDGKNDVIRPIAVGVKEINYFSIYNRWGQLVFTTTTNGKGWDGTLGGVPQTTNVFVWMVKAVDYLGKPVFLKGTFTLIR